MCETRFPKRKSHAFGKDVYLLGVGEDGVYYWLEAASFDCDWYWSVGYVKTYTLDRCPSRSRDIDSHQHFDYLIFSPENWGSKDHSCFDRFKSFFPVNPYTDKEIWQILEIMKSLYTARNYSDMLYTGGSHITTNPASESIKNEVEYKRINEVLIPELLKKLYNIMSSN